MRSQMINEVIKDFTAFLVLESIVLAGYSFSLFILFQYVLQIRESNGGFNDDDEMRLVIESSFGNPLKAVATLFRSTFRGFERKIYNNSGNLSPIITIVFLFYMGTQLVLTLSMLVTFTRNVSHVNVSIKKRQPVRRCTNCLDAFEGELNKNNEMNEGSPTRQLNALYSEQNSASDDMEEWNRRIQIIEANVHKLGPLFHNKVNMKMGEELNQIESLKKEMDQIKQLKEDFNQVTGSTKQAKEDADEVMQIKEYLNDFKYLKDDVKQIQSSMTQIGVSSNRDGPNKKRLHEIKQISNDLMQTKKDLE
eukprot:g3094.t1